MPAEGRFDGDLYAQLVHVPHAGRKQYRVRVWSWDADRKDARWRNAFKDSYFDIFDHEKWFKTAFDAAVYLGKVRGWAEAVVISRARQAALVEQEVRLA